MPSKGDKGDKNAARPPEGSLVETRCLIKGPKSAIVPFPGPRSGPKSRTGPGALARSVPLILNDALCPSRAVIGYTFVCLPPDRKQGLLMEEFLEKGEVGRKPKLCWTMLVIGSVSAM